MENRKKILELRDRLDKTLALPDLADADSLKSLVRKQILESSLPSSQGNVDCIAEERTKEVSNFLEMLRSASGNERASKIHGALQNEWKVKQDTDQLRVMYREGPRGTPFHTLLAEGFADGPIDVCLCVSWESTLYRKWFPQYNVPTFKIVQSDCLKKVQIGEEISLIRVKVPWPVSEREALLHYFELEYLKEDIVLVLMKTISDLENIDIQSHGFSRDGIPGAGDTIRIDIVGGFVLQKVTNERSYFRAIANMDIKLDFVPPWLINFIARQLIGSGHKLYQKAVSTVATCDEDYKQALNGQLYARIREYHNSTDKATITQIEENTADGLTANVTLENHFAAADRMQSTEIVEEDREQNTWLNMDQVATAPSSQSSEPVQHVENIPLISPEVEQALGILDSAIAMLRGNKAESMHLYQKLLNSEAPSEATTTGSGSSHIQRLNVGNDLNGNHAYVPTQDSREAKQGNPLPTEEVYDGEEGRNGSAYTITKTKSTTSRGVTRVHEEESLKTNGFLNQNGFHNAQGSKGARKKTNKWFCCLTPSTIGG